MDENGQCKVCMDAFYNRESKNRRNNVSIAISFDEEVFADNTLSTRRRNIVIDIGKTVRDTFLHIFPRYGLRHIDSIL